jgi:DNA-directed RNA polymerase subunit RPC12/RpoP
VDVERLRRQLQRTVYAVAASQIHRAPDIICEFQNLRTGVISRVFYDASQRLMQARRLLGRKVAGLTEAHRPGRCEAKPSTLGCRHCGFRIILRQASAEVLTGPCSE